MKKDIKEIKECQVRMEENIKHHIHRTDILEDLHRDNATRIVKLEAPMTIKQVFKIVASTATFASTILGAIYLVLKLTGKI